MARARAGGSPSVWKAGAVTPRSQFGTLFAARQITPAPVPRALPRHPRPMPGVPWLDGELPLVEVLRRTTTNAFLLIRDGVIEHEWRRDGVGPADRHSSWSVAKSFVGLLVGQLIDEGRLSDGTRLVEVLPEFATGDAFDRITVGQLLDMSSGIDVEEDYSDLTVPTGFAGMVMTDDLPGYLRAHRGLRFEPGARCEYRSVDTQYLSMIVTRLAGTPLASVVQDRLWHPLGAGALATWNLDHSGGIEKGFSFLNAAPDDFARLGLLILADGLVGATRIVSPQWVQRIGTPAVDAGEGWHYSAQWWHPPGYEGHHDIAAVGIHGQFVYVHPGHRVVVVKLSDHGAEQDEAELIDVFRALAANR
jgi:CubicO group peptidase (beta-lactamase class C family)